MRRNHVTLVATVLLGVMSTLPAVAADKIPAVFPTDVLGKYVGAVTAKYTFGTSDVNTVLTAAGTRDTQENKIESHLLELKAELGLGYGIQAGVSQKIEIDGRTELTFDSDPTAVTKYSGGYNPVFEIAWNPKRPCNSQDPFQISFLYKVKPKGIASRQISDDFTQQSGTAFMSYKLAKLRPYVGYSFTHYGNSNFGSIGHSDTIMGGVEYSAAKRLKLNLDYSAVISRGDYLVCSNTTNNIGASVEYKVPVTTVGIYLVPFVKAGFNERLTYKTAGTGYDSITGAPFVIYSSGLAMKAVF